MNRKQKYPVNKSKIVENLSYSRMSSYLLFPPSSTEEETIFAYDYMQRLSVHLFLPLQYLEVVLRNRIYKVLTEHYRWRGKQYRELGKAEDWLEWMPSHKDTQKIITQTKRNLGLFANMPDDLISNLTFGVWVKLLQEYPDTNSHYHFWIFTQKRLFPNALGETRQSICTELKTIRDIRNRLFHYEPIWSGNGINNYVSAIIEIIKKYKQIMKAISWLSVDIFNLLKRQRHERELARQSLFYYRILKHTDSIQKNITELSK